MDETRLWLSISEAANEVGYHRDHIQRLARESRKTGKEIEPFTYKGKILVRISADSFEYEVHMPSLREYIKNARRGPQSRKKSKEE
jgi:hypothetical protein